MDESGKNEPKCKRTVAHIQGKMQMQPPKSRAKASKTVVGTVLLAGLSLILATCVKPTLAFLAAVVGLIALVVSIVQTIKGKKKLSVKHTAIGAFILLEMILLTYWRVDAAPIPNDYSINDLRSAPLGYSVTYALLNKLADKNDHLPDAPAVGLSLEDLQNLEEINRIFKEADLQTISQHIKANADRILSIWQNAKKGRAILKKLAVFPQIADLTEPDLLYSLPWTKNFKHLLFLHRAYICLQSCNGNHEAAIDEFKRLHSIVQKLNLNARMIVLKLVCFAYTSVNIQTANFMINNPDTPQAALLTLRQRMVPLSNEHTSLRNPMIAEYLMFKKALMKVAREPRFRYSHFPAVKFNSTLRVHRNFCDRWIDISEHRTQSKEFRVWPAVYVNLPVRMTLKDGVPWYYKAYNPIGSHVIEMLTPAMGRVLAIRTKLEIHSDLLQIVLNKRLGREVNLEARAYGGEYIVDVENRKVFSPGPDGKTGTKDDITLPINPELLGW